MLAQIFKAVLITSLAGSFLAVVIALLKPVTKKVFGYSWHYYIWFAVLFVMIAPVRFSLPQNSADIPAVNTQTVQSEQITENAQTDIADTTQTVNTTITAAQKATNFIGMILDNRMNYLGIIWILGMVFCLLININGYIRLIRKIHKNSVIITCPEASNYTDKKITVRKGRDLSSPFMLGVFRPTLVLPDRDLSAEQLNNILRHEMTHFRRKDILYKWFALIVRSVHWFNPVVYYVTRQINNECEISCDLSVVSQMNGDEQMSYVNTILSLASSDRVKRVPLTTQMASGKKALKRRFTMIKNVKKTNKFISALSAAIAVVMLGTTVFASGVLSDMTTDDYTVELINHGEKIELTNKPFVENGEAYLPLRETIEKICDYENTSRAPSNEILWNDGQIRIRITYEEYDPEIDNTHIYTNNYGIEIGKANLIDPVHPGPDDVVDIEMANAPVLKNSVTYIPFSYIVNMFNANGWIIHCCIYDKDGKLADISVDKPEDYADLVSWEPEPEIFADPYSDFLISNMSEAHISDMFRAKGYGDGTYSYEYINHVYNDANDKVDFYYQIKPFGEDEIKFLKMSFEKRGDEWTMYNTSVADEINTD